MHNRVTQKKVTREQINRIWSLIVLIAVMRISVLYDCLCMSVCNFFKLNVC